MLLSLCAASTTLVAAAPPSSGLAPTGDEAKYISNITQMTNQEMGFLNAGEAYFSPDQRTIIFQATPTDKQDYQIFTMDLATRKTAMVSTGEGACTCAYFHPGGKKIIFASTHLAPNGDHAKDKDSADYKWAFDDGMDVFEAAPDGSNLKRLTDTPGYDAECAYSPDGAKIVFTSKRDGDLELYVMNADGSSQHRLTNTEGYDGGPFFSPDGKLILYRADYRGDGKMNLQLRLMNADATGDRAITDNPLFNWCPYWHPSGTCWIFTQTDHSGRPNYDLFMMDKSGKNLTRITFDTAFDGLPVFSPDGKKLMWTSQRGGLEEPQIFIADFTMPEGMGDR